MNELTFLYVHGTQIGYARAGSLIADELTRRGVTVYDDDGRPTKDDFRSDSVKLLSKHYRPAPSPTNVVCWVSVPTHSDGFFEGQHKAILTMWEAMRLPESFRENLHEFQTVIVPSQQNVELFSQYHDNVQLLLLGVDGEKWKYTPPDPPGRFFDFFISGRGPRKGIDIAYEAFKTVFGHWWTYGENGPEYIGPKDRPEPRLIMKSLKGHGKYYSAGVQHTTGLLSEQAELDMYLSCHAYIQPSRGEGFGLQPLQAMAVGRPTILTDAHGHESFAKLGVPLPWKAEKASYFIYGDAGEWWNPDFEATCEAMWDVYSNYDAHAARAKESAAVIARDFTWSNTADRFLEILGPEMAKPYAGDGTWRKPEPRLYKIISNQDFYAERCGESLYFKAGQTYYDQADVKRILFDAGLLAAECIEEDDPGLAPNQIEHIEAYKAAYSYCPTCSQQLNTQPKLSDVLYEEMTSAGLS